MQLKVLIAYNTSGPMVTHRSRREGSRVCESLRNVSECRRESRYHITGPNVPHYLYPVLHLTLHVTRWERLVTLTNVLLQRILLRKFN